MDEHLVIGQSGLQFTTQCTCLSDNSITSFLVDIEILILYISNISHLYSHIGAKQLFKEREYVSLHSYPSIVWRKNL